MPATSRLQTQDYGYSATTTSGVWRWTVRLDVSGTAPTYTIRDISSPYGLLRDSIPLPGAVVVEMAAAIATLQQAYAPEIMIGPVTLTFTVDEGAGFSEPQSVTITNTGVFGSLLAVTLSSSASYLQANPTSVGGVGSSESAVFQVTVDSSDLYASSSPYAAALLLQSTTAVNSPVTLPVTIVVRPKASISLSTTALSFSAVRPLTGPFAPVATQTFTITNTGPAGSVLEFLIQRLTNCCSWLASVYPLEGSLPSGNSQVITVAVVPPEGMLSGVYTETLRISGYSDNSYQDVTITLTIT